MRNKEHDSGKELSTFNEDLDIWAEKPMIEVAELVGS